MQAILDATHVYDRRSLGSYDSGEEFSIYHWIEVCKLVDEGDVPLTNEGLPSCEEIEEALEKTMSEVEAATTYQDFTGNIVR